MTVPVSGDAGEPKPGDTPATAGSPFFRMIDLPPVPGNDLDARPIAVVAAEPWRTMRIWGGASAEALTARGDAVQPTTVGTLIQSLHAGVRHRWDWRNNLIVRVEGRDPESRPDAAVFAGANAVAVETAGSWEIVQYRQASVVSEGVWRLSGLLRGQQGTEDAALAGAQAGALVVLLDTPPVRIESAVGERGLPLLWRAGPLGGPAGGKGVSEITYAVSGAHSRPWSPAHLTLRPRTDGGVDIAWVARLRIDGDRWDGLETGGGALSYRLRVMKDGAEIRSWEVVGTSATYAASALASDFADGLEGGLVGVAEWGEGYGWGVEATGRLADSV